MLEEIDAAALGETNIVVGGPVGGNKARIADALHRYIGQPEYRFSSYLKRVAESRGWETSYKTLQDLGEHVIRTKPWPAFCHEVLGPKGQAPEGKCDAAPVPAEPTQIFHSLASEVRVVDGVRHVFAVRWLRQLAAPAEAVVIYVDASREEQYDTLKQRGNDEKEIRRILHHPVEAETGLVSMMADFKIKEREAVESVVSDVVEILEKGRQRTLEVLHTKTGAPRDELEHWRQTAPEKYETFREVVTLIGAVASDESVMRWLRTPQASIGGQKPWDVITTGDRDLAVAAAIDAIQNP